MSPTCCARDAVRHQQRIRRIDDDQILHAQQRHDLLAAIDIVAGRVGAEQFGSRGVRVGIVRHAVRKRHPSCPTSFQPNSSQATPTTLSACSMHAEIDRNVFAEREHFGEFCGEIGMRIMPAGWRSASRSSADACAWHPAPFPPSRKTSRRSRSNCPARKNFFAVFRSGFSWKLATSSASRATRGRPFRKLDVAITGLRPAWLDSEDADLALFGGFESSAAQIAGIASAVR